jgi:hypothetical protein
LPHLGGNPIAWNNCLVFFQATLLAGYVYANLLHRFRGVRWQPWVHFLLMGIGLVLCFVGVFGERLLAELAPRLQSIDDWPILSTLCLLIVAIGLPFLTLAAVSPLVQRWFAHLDHPKASDPYFLFAASNLGGLTALVLYPLLIEPYTLLAAQWLSWKLAVTALGTFLFLAALCVWVSPRSPELEPAPPSDDPSAPVVPTLIGRGPATVGRRLYWLFASAIPVGLLMGVTDYLTLDVAPAPILWTLPLALYLLAFSQSFARFGPWEMGNFVLRLVLQIIFGVIAVSATVTVIVVIGMQGFDVRNEVLFLVVSCAFFFLMIVAPFNWLWVLQPLSAVFVISLQAHLFWFSGMRPGLMLLYLTTFYLSVRLCLGMLAKDRPAASALTTYYTWMGIGGLCGGLFQLLIAPLIFRRDYLEYSLLAALACTLREAWFPHGLTDWVLCKLLFRKRKPDEAPSTLPIWIARGFDLVFAGAFALFAGLILLIRYKAGPMNLGPRPPGLVHDMQIWIADFPLLIALASVLVLLGRPVRFGLALTAIVALSFIGRDARSTGNVIVQERTSFGMLRVTETSNFVEGPDRQKRLEIKQRTLLHSTINHGICITEPAEYRRVPTTYYNRQGPVGLVMRNLEWFPPPGNPGSVDNAKDDARIAASLVGLCAGNGGPFEPISAAWSEPPYALVGLGVGTQFAYAHPFQCVDAYEIDPAMIELSTKEQPTFHYYQAALNRGVNARIIAGDARRKLSQPGHEGYYHAIFVDAFNSDAIPTHLLTKEAIELYFQKLAPEGILCVHTSNRHVELPGVLHNVSRKLNVSCATVHYAPERLGADPTNFTSEWVFLARHPNVLRKWLGNERPDIRPDFNGPPTSANLLWTDERASVLSAVRPNQGWPMLVYALLVMILFFGFFLGMIEIAWSMLPNVSPPPGNADQSK